MTTSQKKTSFFSKKQLKKYKRIDLYEKRFKKNSQNMIPNLFENN